MCVLTEQHALIPKRTGFHLKLSVECKECVPVCEVEGEDLKDTTLAAVIISWFTARVIYEGGLAGQRLLQLL